jgi:hypothetical protein
MSVSLGDIGSRLTRRGRVPHPPKQEFVRCLAGKSTAMTDEPIPDRDDSGAGNEPDEEYASGGDPNGEPWAKTSSGDEEHVTSDDD